MARSGQYAIYGLDDVILNTEGRMQMRYNMTKYLCYVAYLTVFIYCLDRKVNVLYKTKTMNYIKRISQQEME